ncbi:MAG: tetratricopeptide repeat protein [Nitrospinaceae bacterium]|nr:tetratricopeptide repeat protein [Nitrospinaceae bacterium]NIR57507.1 tetratricopeptide repeat protein [Nitrospinaceae bacterium]NIU47022.1 tetratricopeptide repeat protein [Nitrospinaceae bacterium]NIU99223.1 tetratricopeptide repeat protein [Nitrospinaceae bacterium]NIW08578.1 tetratricopeptide repeat protein [Nitrospinaceae bacterium]
MIFLILGLISTPAGADPGPAPPPPGELKPTSFTTREAFEDRAERLRQRLEQEEAAGAAAGHLAETHYQLAKFVQSDEEKIDHYQRCLETADAALEQNPRSAKAYFFRGLCTGRIGQLNGLWSSLNRVEPFRRCVEKALAIDASVAHGGPHRALGMYYLELPFILGGDVDKSIQHFKAALRLAPEFGQNHYVLALAYYEQGRYPQARESLQRFFQLTSADDPDPELQKYRKKGRTLLQEIARRLDSRESHAPRTENP